MVARNSDLALALAGPSLAACDRDRDPAGPPAGNPSYSFALAPDLLIVQPGAQGVVSLLVNRDSRFTGEVTFSATGTPTGATITIDGQSPASLRYFINVAVLPTMNAGTHTITIRATRLANWIKRQHSR